MQLACFTRGISVRAERISDSVLSGQFGIFSVSDLWVKYKFKICKELRRNRMDLAILIGYTENNKIDMAELYGKIFPFVVQFTDVRHGHLDADAFCTVLRCAAVKGFAMQHIYDTARLL